MHRSGNSRLRWLLPPGDCGRSAHRSPLGEPQMTQAEDSGRFYALRVPETGLIKSSPQKIMAQARTGVFLNDLKRQRKG
jgi:hypothetical protein